MEERKLFPNIKQAFLLLLLFIVLQVALIIPLVILQMFGVIQDIGTIGNALPTVAIFIILVIGISKNSQSFREAYALVPVRTSLYVPMLVTLLGTGVVISELNNLLEYYWPAPDWLRDMFSGNGLELFVLVVIMAPVMEELLFRGLFLKGFLTHTGKTKAIIWSAVLFGFAHLNPWQFMVAFIAGLLFGWWYAETKSLLPGMIGHAFHNGFPFVLAAINLQIPGYTIAGEFQPLWFNILGLVFAIAGMIWTRRKLVQVEEN